MSLTPAEADTLRQSLATAVVVPVTPFQAAATRTGTPTRL